MMTSVVLFDIIFFLPDSRLQSANFRVRVLACAQLGLYSKPRNR